MPKAEQRDEIAVAATPVRWVIAAMVGVLAFVSYLLRMNISVAAELMKPALGLSNTQMAHVFSGFLIGYGLFQIPAGKLGDVIGPRIVLAVAALLWGCASLA